MSRLEFEHPAFRLRGKFSNRLCQRRKGLKIVIIYICRDGHTMNKNAQIISLLLNSPQHISVLYVQDKFGQLSYQTSIYIESSYSILQLTTDIILITCEMIMSTSYLSVVACQPNYVSCKLSKQHIHMNMLHVIIMCFAYRRQNDVTLHIGTCLKHVQSDIFPESNIFSGFLKK